MISRRRFLLQSTTALASMLCAPAIIQQIKTVQAAQNNLATSEYFLVGDGAKGKSSLSGSEPYAPIPGRVRIWQIGQKRPMEIDLPFFPHSFTSHPEAPHRVITFEKWGRHMAEIDLKTFSVVRITQSEPERRFFGHGAHAGKYIYATQMDDGHGRGMISVMEATSHKVIQEFATLGAFPHDCQWLAAYNTLLVVNSRSSPDRDKAFENHSSLVYLDAQTGNCSKQIFIETPEYGYAHFARSTDGYTILSGSFDTMLNGSRPLLAVICPDESIRILGITSSSLRGEALSLYLNETDHLMAATLPLASQVQIWNYRSGELIRQIAVAEPRGLCYSSKLNKLLVTSAGPRNLLDIDIKFDHAPNVIASHMGGNGSHILRLII